MVAQSPPTYAMSCFLLTKNICEALIDQTHVCKILVGRDRRREKDSLEVLGLSLLSEGGRRSRVQEFGVMQCWLNKDL